MIQGLLSFLQYGYIRAIVIFFTFFIVSKLAIFISEKVILRITKKTKTKLDDLIINKINKPISLILLLIGIRLAIIPLGLSEKYGNTANLVVSSFIVIIIVYIIIAVIDVLIDNWGKKWAEKTKSTIDDHLLSLLRRFSKIIFTILGLLFILDLWGIQIGPLLASLGIAGIAVAFALQSTLGNIFGGISMIIDKTIKVGDVVEIDAETKGTVLDVGLRSTKIRTFNNEIITIPNGKLASSKIINYVLPDPSARVVVPFSTAYGVKIDKVKKTVLKEINKIKNLKKDHAPTVRFTEMGDSALLFKAYFWVKNYKKRFEAKETANVLIYNALNKAKISIPFPQMDVHLKKR